MFKKREDLHARTLLAALLVSVFLASLIPPAAEAGRGGRVIQGAAIGAGVGALAGGGSGARKGAAVGALVGAVR